MVALKKMQEQMALFERKRLQDTAEVQPPRFLQPRDFQEDGNQLIICCSDSIMFT